MSVKGCLRLFPIYHPNSREVCGNFLGTSLLKKHVTPITFHTQSNSRFAGTSTKNEMQVYYGLLTPQIKAVKIFSLSSSVVGVAAQPFLYTAIATTGNIPIIVAAYSFIGFFTVATPLLLHSITRNYITHLAYKKDTDTYIARTVSFFCQSVQTEFKPEEVKVPDVPGMFTTFIVRGKKLFLDPRLFDNPDHYARLMGYDKPIDFKLYQNDTEENMKK
ncbi:unnamed protein product [Callosobruchus maculatus]|uniref:Transmembrane protein 70 homolog, mitochondrial n=1 Tax=Callosobruchus maculatus TaxID=64391 RepID=A0A653BWK8_CALMS|nr:unnamed protein product [Callosobruchus maculatus]